MLEYQREVAEIDLDAIADNMRNIKKIRNIYCLQWNVTFWKV